MKPFSKGNIQITLALLKPDITRVPYNLAYIRQLILDRDFIVARSKFINLKRSQAEDFYSEHKGKFFYNRLVTYMSSGTCHAHILAKPNAITDWRSLMGPTKVMKTRYEHPNTMRGMFGLTDTRNTSHGSDSDETAVKEMKFFFPEFDREDFFEKEVPRFCQLHRENLLKLDISAFVHTLN